MADKAEKAVLQVGGKSYELPVVVGSEQEVGIDIRQLRQQSGAVTLDDGYMNTGACSSAITFLDGEKGILRYRGYPIEQLAEKATFMEVAYLLLNGELPKKTQLEEFNYQLTRHSLIHEDMKRFFLAFPPSAHPMAILSAVVSGLSTFYNEPDAYEETRAERTTMRLLAKLPTIAAFSHRKSLGQPFVYPDNSLGYSANFLQMMFGFPTEKYAVDEEIAKVLDVLMILHADHEQNCSTSTVRMVGSSGANLYAAISAGICALWGPLHGGANQQVLEMLEEIHQNGGDVAKAIAMAKDKSSTFRLMGFGHRVYKNFDPRATLIKKQCDIVLNKLGKKDPLLEIAKKLEEAALKDSYFVEKKLYPNVDFYSGIIYRALGIPTNMFTVMFALGRLPGWIAQWKEMHKSGAKIGRPRQIYVGSNERKFVPMSDRGV